MQTVAHCQVGTSGHKSLRYPNMWVWMCSVAVSQLWMWSVILCRVQILSWCSSLVDTKAQSQKHSQHFAAQDVCRTGQFLFFTSSILSDNWRVTQGLTTSKNKSWIKGKVKNRDGRIGSKTYFWIHYGMSKRLTNCSLSMVTSNQQNQCEILSMKKIL